MILILAQKTNKTQKTPSFSNKKFNLIVALLNFYIMPFLAKIISFFIHFPVKLSIKLCHIIGIKQNVFLKKIYEKIFY